MIVDKYTAVFRCYSDMSIYILGHSDDNELVLGQVLDCIHEVFDRIFKGQFERKSLVANMSSVILVIDEVIDQGGIVMHTQPSVIHDRIKKQKQPSAGVASAIQEEHSASSSMFSSMFGAAKSSLARTMGL